MSKFNAWANPSEASTADAMRMAAFLEERSNRPDLQQVNQKFCQVVDARPGERLLEVGSGSGVLSRLLAAQVQPQGCVVGLDISPEMNSQARKYAFAAGLSTEIDFQTGRAENLPFPNASFDGALAARTLLHIPDPDAVLGELIRVVRPGGRVVAMDWDFDSVTVDHPDRELTRRLMHWRSDHHGGNNWSGRQLWRHMQLSGLQNLSVHSWVTVSHNEADALTQSLWRAAQVACEGGAISASEQEAWVQLLKDRIQAGAFFASIVYFIVKGFVASNQIKVV